MIKTRKRKNTDDGDVNNNNIQNKRRNVTSKSKPPTEGESSSEDRDRMSDHDEEHDQLEAANKKVGEVSDLFRKQNEQIEMIARQMTEFSSSQTFLSKQFDTFQSDITKLVKDNKLLKKECNENKTENQTLNRKVATIEKQIRVFHQDRLSHHMIVTNLPKFDTNIITLNEIVKELANQAGYELINTEIEEVYQTENKKFNTHPLIIKMKTSTLKTKLMNFRKNKNKFDISTLTTDHSAATKVNVNVHHLMTKEMSELFKQVKKKANDLQYKHVWIKGGTILARKEENSPVIEINGKEDMAKLN